MREQQQPTPSRTYTFICGGKTYVDELVLVHETRNHLVWTHVFGKEWTPGGPTDSLFIEDKSSGICMLVAYNEAREWDFETSTPGPVSFRIARKR